MPHTSLIETLDLLAALQRECGAALLSETQKEIALDPPFEEQTATTYQTLAAAQKENSDFSLLLPERFFDAFALRNNDSFRQNNKKEYLIDWYHVNLQQPIYQMAITNITNNPHFSPAQVSAIIHLIASLNYLNSIRDLGILVYAKAEISLSDISKFKNTAKSFFARENLYLSLADDKLRKTMDDMKGSPIGSVSNIDEILRRIKSGFVKSVLAETSFINWFTLFNSEIDKNHNALKQTLQTLTENDLETAHQNSYNRILDQDVEQFIPTINALPLFRGVTEITLRMILKGAHLTTLSKNTLFLRQGENINKLYVILKGWVKTYKTNADGQESILQILNSKECILDTGFDGQNIAGLSAKTITETQILTIPISVMHDYLSRNRELAQNLLTSTQVRLYKLVNQYEQVTLSTAIQRVGWFLVNLHLETGLEGKPLHLPFDKSLIAAYLNIKPETFSRTLRSFRNKGFKINKHEVELPTPDALCEYCDPEMAIRCCRAETVKCAPLQAARKAKDN